MSTECVSIKQEVDIEIAPELVNIKEEVDTESLFIKQEPEDDVLSNTNAYSETTEIAPKFVNTQLEVEKEPLFVKQEPGLNVLSNTNEACETEEIGPEFVSVKQEIEIECSEFSAIEMEVITDAHQHQQQLQQETQRNIQSPQTRPYSNAERQRRYREKRKADKMNFCTTFSQSSDDQTQQEQPQHDIQINKRQPLSSAERQRRYRKSLREKRQQQQQMGDVNAITVQQKVDPAVLERKRQLNKQRQSRFRARQRFEWSSTSSHQGQTERVQSNVSPREYKQEFWEEQEINQRNRENENLQQTVKSETNSDSKDLTSNNESVEQTAFNHTMADQPDEPIETTPITDLQLPSMSYLPTIAAPKSNAQIHREYRQRIALTRTPEQLLAARKADAERQRKCRLRKVNLALKSNAQIQREYRQRKAESRTPEQVLAARKSDAERQRKCRQRQKSNYVQTGTRQQLTKQQLRTSAAEPAQITAQPGTSAHIEVQQAQSTWNTKRASSYKSTCLGNDFGACSFCDRLCYKKDLEHITAAQLKVTSEWSIKENRRLCTEEYEMVCHTCKRSLNKKSSAQIQREYRQRVAASRTPEQVLAARKSAAERQRKCRLRKDDNSTLVSGSSESTTASSFPTGAKSSDVRTGTQRQTSATEPPRIAVQPGNDFGHACSVCDRLYFKNDLEPITALQLEVISEWYIKENRRLCREEYEMACKNCKCSLDNKSMPPLAKEIGFSWRGEREGSGMAGSGEGTPRPHHTDTAER